MQIQLQNVVYFKLLLACLFFSEVGKHELFNWVLKEIVDFSYITYAIGAWKTDISVIMIYQGLLWLRKNI